MKNSWLGTEFDFWLCAQHYHVSDLFSHTITERKRKYNESMLIQFQYFYVICM